jgi:hypothetical protein
VLAKLNFYEYHEVVQQSLLTTSNGQTCVNNIIAATHQIEQYMASQDGTKKVRIRLGFFQFVNRYTLSLRRLFLLK